VHFSVAQNVHIDLDITIGSGTYIGCGSHILSGSVIGKNCKIHEFASVENAHLGDNCEIFPHSIVKDSSIGADSQIGPFAHIREHSHIGEQVVLGNFVEVKKSTIGKGTKAKHLTYLGDAQIGAQVNIGAGTITCNYTGLSKHQTIIHDNAFIGSNNTLIAPITIGSGAYTAAGSVISEMVPAEALAIARARQVNKDGYAHQLRDIKTPEAAELATNTLHSFIGALKTKNPQTSEPS
jgi:bifunctional UDP-N-acetylglucosamine pyrophosphorylase/glucosamine-1-phosphate N-acetyltransferase